MGGFGLLGLTLFIIGQWSFARVTIGAVLATASATSLIHLWRVRDTLLNSLRLIPTPPVVPALVVAFVLTITAIGGLAEPVGDWGTDGVAYHLVGPKVWLREGVVRPVPDNAPTSYPSTAEMVFAALMAFGGQRAPGFSAVLTISLFLMLAGSLALRCGLDSSGAWWVAAIAVIMPALYGGAHSGFVDVTYASFILAAARVGFDAEERIHFTAFGIFCGLAAATKYPGLVALPALLFCAVWPRKGFLHKEGFKRAGIAAISACVVASPMYLRNWILLGSPIYPPPATATHFLHVKYFSANALRGFYAWSIHRGQGHGRGLVKLFLLPFNLTYHTADFHGAGGIGLAPLAFGPMGVIASRHNYFSRRLALLGALLLVLWFVSLQESRYLIHVYAISAVLAVIGWRYSVSLLVKRGRLLSAIVVGLSILYGLYMIGSSRLADIHSVFSSSYARKRRQMEIPFVESFDFLNRDPSVSRVLILDPSVPAYYSDKEYLKPFGQWGEQVLPTAPTPEDVLARLGELKISHILDVRSSISEFRVPANFPGVVLVFERPDQKVYRMSGLE